jgi:Putative carbohydrate metabolism domain
MKNRGIYILLLIIALQSCVKEDYFGYSPYGNIKSIEVSNQASQAVIDPDSLLVSIELPPGVDATALEIQTLELSSFATSDKALGDLLNLSDTETIHVTSEGGLVSTWTIQPFVASSTPKLDNSDFNLWYKTDGGYFEPGQDASTTIWGTGNPGTQILNLLATTPLEITHGNKAAYMETLDNGKVATTFGTPISAGSIFTGVFDSNAIDPTDPQAAISFGTSFAGRPSSFSFKYQYVPGDENKDKHGTLLPYGDMCDIYAYLEIRSGGDTERLATAWFRNGAVQADLVSESIDFTYGELDDSFPAYMYPENGKYVSADSASFVLPTHIIVVASSSYDGANFAGAIGSTLTLDDVELIYE